MTHLGLPTDRPFTLHTAGCSRAVLRRLELAGEVRRVLRGVYASTGLELTPALRRRAVGLVIPEGAVPTGLAAAWVHGLVDDCAHVTSGHREPVTLLEAATVTGRVLGLPVYDAALRHGLPHRQLLMAVAPDQLAVAALADGRAWGAAESTLRKCWYAADLPTPRLGYHLRLGREHRRVALAHPGRSFAAATDPWSREELRAARASGWWVSAVPPERVSAEAEDLLSGHLRRDFHRQLLAQLSA